MKTSVVMATLNSGQYLQTALESIAAQTLPVHETVIVDGGSTDETIAIAQSFPFVRVIAQTGKGLPDAWNTGIKATVGDCITFLDSDDYWTPVKISLQVAALEQDPSLLAVIGHVRFFVEEGAQSPVSFKPERLIGTHAASMPGTLMVRRSIFDTLGYFDTRFPITCDIDWFARVRDLNLPLLTLPDLFMHKRVHETNLGLKSDSQPSYQRELVQLLFEKRRRKIGSAHGS